MNERRDRPKDLEPAGRFADLRLLLGRAAGVVGIVFALIGVLELDISMEFMGVVFGLVGYLLGSRTLGVAVMVLSTAMLVIVLLVARGYIPGIDPTYAGVF